VRPAAPSSGGKAAFHRSAIIRGSGGQPVAGERRCDTGGTTRVAHRAGTYRGACLASATTSGRLRAVFLVRETTTSESRRNLNGTFVSAQNSAAEHVFRDSYPFVDGRYTRTRAQARQNSSRPRGHSHIASVLLGRAPYWSFRPGMRRVRYRTTPAPRCAGSPPRWTSTTGSRWYPRRSTSFLPMRRRWSSITAAGETLPMFLAGSIAERWPSHGGASARARGRRGYPTICRCVSSE
jgi:hypothetical protein